MGKRRITKKELRHDPLLEFANKVINFVFREERKEKILWGFVGLTALLVIAIFYFSSKGTPNPPDAEVKYLQAVSLYARGDTTAYTILEELVTRYRNTDSGKRALYYLAVYLENDGRMDEAERYFREFLSSGLKDEFLMALAHGHLGEILMDNGKPREAAEYFIKARDMIPSKNFKAFYQFKAATAYKDAGMRKEALDLLDNFEDLYGDTPVITELRGEIRILRGYLAMKKEASEVN
jgi:tetratricopeptide (TPR) repeat protein